MYKLYFLAGLIILQGCNGQNTGQEFYSKEFDWKIIIPPAFEKVDDKEAERLQNKGLEVVESTYQDEIEDRTRKIILYRSGKLNYIEANCQPFDPEKDGAYEESTKAVKDILYQTFISQMEGIKVDTVSSRETVSGKEFDKFAITVKFPNDMILHTIMYSRLFEKQEFTVNIVYADEEKGTEMMAAWRNSVFSGKVK